ncbi:MAG: hypothetical protein HC883_01905 [Bdellovibrionaceae bacterium]|nr:hypothetical protein [Pseudobdellovibrionaceae bacterium]
MKQLTLLPNSKNAYGGDLRNTRKGRSGPRPLATKSSMHLVLRSSKAKGAWSFRAHKGAVRRIVERFGVKYGVRIVSLANVGNHLHFQIQLGDRFTYAPFIRAITSAIAMAVSGNSRWRKKTIPGGFWDRRPFTRVIIGWRAVLGLRDYIMINKIEGHGYSREEAQWLLRNYRESPA